MSELEAPPSNGHLKGQEGGEDGDFHADRMDGGGLKGILLNLDTLARRAYFPLRRFLNHHAHAV